MAIGALVASHVTAGKVKTARFYLAVILLLVSSISVSWASSAQKNLLLFSGTMRQWHYGEAVLDQNRLTIALATWHKLQYGEAGNFPITTVVFDRTPAFWQQNRRCILTLTVAAIFLSHLLLVLWLLTEMHKRRVADSTLKNLSHYLIGTAEQERRRIARELHDDVNQRMALLSIEIDRLQADAACLYPALGQRLKRVLREANGISADISRVSQELHSSALEFLGLIPALRRLCREFSEHQNIHVSFHATEPAAQISSEISLCLFRIAQECLTNVGRHSGAKSVDVQLGCKGANGLLLTVADDGRGFETNKLNEKVGLGILSMRERLRLVGGELALHAAPGEGTYIAAMVPFAYACKAEEEILFDAAADAATSAHIYPPKKSPKPLAAITKYVVRPHSGDSRVV